MELRSDLLFTDHGILSTIMVGIAFANGVLTARKFLKNVTRESQRLASCYLASTPAHPVDLPDGLFI